MPDFIYHLLSTLLIRSIIYIIIYMKNKVAYLYNEEITKYEFSKEHPMKTKRVKMAHSLLYNYGITKSLDMYHSKQATSQQLKYFHHPHYIKYLESWVNPKASHIVQQYACEEDRLKAREDPKMRSIFKINHSFDCPGFEGLYNFCQLAAGGSIDAADLILTGQADIVINWAGGFHHAKKTQASGFCYINDIVLCILELLKVYPRVLYLDIDVHHGDGVEEAFYHTNRVMTVSFHQFSQDFFPGTGSLDSIGQGIGKYFTVNVPLKKGIDDISYIQLFKRVMNTVVGSYRPDVFVIQCGADSLSKDKLGHLNLSIKGHAEAIQHMMTYGTPMVLLGGGGYTIQNVSRCWAYQTAMVLGKSLPQDIPQTDSYYNFYEKQGHKLVFAVDKVQNQNSQAYINEIVSTITDNMRQADMRPSICYHTAPKPFLPTQQNDWQIIEDDQDSMMDEGMERVLKKC